MTPLYSLDLGASLRVLVFFLSQAKAGPEEVTADLFVVHSSSMSLAAAGEPWFGSGTYDASTACCSIFSMAFSLVLFVGKRNTNVCDTSKHGQRHD